MDKNFLQFKKPRNSKCKCQTCGKEGKSNEFFRHLYLNRNSKPTIKYYCCREHFHDEYMNKKYYHKTQLLVDKIIGYTCINKQKITMITNLYKVGFSREDVYKCLLEHKDEIIEYLNAKDIESEYCKLRYIFTVLENNIKDYSSGIPTIVKKVKGEEVINISESHTEDYGVAEFKGNNRRKSIRERLGK